MTRSTQRSFKFKKRNWGGVRKNAGRLPKDGLRREKPGVSHLARPRITRHQPAHVTLRVLDHVWNLRTKRCFRHIEWALHAAGTRPDFRVVHFSVLGNHVHLLVEADNARALSSALRSITIRIAHNLNKVMGRKGRVFSDRYHVRVVKTPSEARHALIYVLQNFRKHAEQTGERVPTDWLDLAYSSAAAFDGWRGLEPSTLDRTPVAVPKSWLLNEGWRRRGLIALHETPRQGRKRAR